MRSRRELLSTLMAAPFAQRPPARRPSILFILIDDLRWDDLGCAGHPFARTPNIDRIAREGAMFRNAFVTTPLCSPSRASFLTGLYAHTHGIVDNTERGAQSHKLATFPRALHAAGYETGYIGKWHMGNDDSPRPGFDHWVSFRGQGTYLNPDINENGKTSKVAGYVTDIFTDRAVAFLERRRAKPFFLYLAHKAVHPETVQRADGSLSDPSAGVFLPAERHRALYAGQGVPRRLSAGRAPEGKPALLRKIGNLPPLGPTTGTDDETVRNRLRILAAVDEGAGRILRALERSGQLDNTMIVFSSDNGYFYGEHGLSVERRLAYEESARIPLLVRYPRLARPGSAIDGFALNIDLAPTLLEVAGAEATRPLHGRSLVPLLKRAAGDWRSSFLIEYFSDKVFPRMVNMGYQAVRTARWKYIRYREIEAADELYDLQADPYEMNNLIAEPAARASLDEMKKELERLLRATAA
jgi:N-acetylglucosamine-6-sulfatase